MVRVLLVANKTLGSGEVSEYVRNRMSRDDCEFTLLVPAIPGRDNPASRLAGGLASALDGVEAARDTPDNYEQARTRLEYGLGVLQGLGATVDGSVGDPDPGKAIAEVLKQKKYDEVALSMLPEGVSRWFRLDVPSRVERKFHVPVTIIRVNQGANT